MCHEKLIDKLISDKISAYLFWCKTKKCFRWAMLSLDSYQIGCFILAILDPTFA